MRKLNADPEFAKANAERMRKLHADPEFAKAHAERGAERMRKLNADKMAALGLHEPHQIDAFRVARKAGFSKKEALRIALADKNAVPSTNRQPSEVRAP